MLYHVISFIVLHSVQVYIGAMEVKGHHISKDYVYDTADLGNLANL